MVGSIVVHFSSHWVLIGYVDIGGKITASLLPDGPYAVPEDICSYN